MATSNANEEIGARIANAIRSTCRSYRWSQRELAARLDTNQSAVRRLLRGGPAMDVRLASAAFDLLGIRFGIDADPIGLAARRDQRDAIHARCTAYVAGLLRRHGWLVDVEVEIGEGRFRGWIDVLAFRPTDGALLVIEIKTWIDDLGRTLRSVGWYVRASRDAALRRGWQPTRTVPILLALATTDTEARIAAGRDLVHGSLEGRADLLEAWIADAAAAPASATFALIDPRSRRRSWLLRTRSDGRRSPAPYPDLGAAALVLLSRASGRRSTRSP